MSRRAARIEVSSLGFHYPGEAAALVDVSFSVEPGQFVALMGPNGSGKTTLIKILLRLLTPQSGSVRFDGSDVRELSPAELYQNVGMVFQNPCDQLFAPTVEEDVAFGPRNLKLPADEVRRRVDEALATVGLTALAARPIHHLSFGEQKRVCLAGVLAMKPAVLLMDEPTAGLDHDCERHMVELLGRLNREQGITVIMATHSVDLLPTLARRALVLCRGRLLADGPLEEVFGDSDLIARAGLRLPLIGQLFHELARQDGLGFESMPMTIGQARQALLERLMGQGDAIGRGDTSRPGGDA
jgi:cobalt/nickel transport system ATP-binding protein